MFDENSIKPECLHLCPCVPLCISSRCGHVIQRAICTNDKRRHATCSSIYLCETCLQSGLACSSAITPIVSKLSPVMADGSCGLVAAEDKHGGNW